MKKIHYQEKIHYHECTPPLNLFDLSQYYYVFFKSRLKKCCTKIFLEAFREIHEYTWYGFKNVDKINRGLYNCFFKAFVQSTTKRLKHMDNRLTKKRQLSYPNNELDFLTFYWFLVHFWSIYSKMTSQKCRNFNLVRFQNKNMFFLPFFTVYDKLSSQR